MNISYRNRSQTLYHVAFYQAEFDILFPTLYLATEFPVIRSLNIYQAKQVDLTFNHFESCAPSRTSSLQHTASPTLNCNKHQLSLTSIVHFISHILFPRITLFCSHSFEVSNLSKASMHPRIHTFPGIP